MNTRRSFLQSIAAAATVLFGRRVSVATAHNEAATQHEPAPQIRVAIPKWDRSVDPASYRGKVNSDGFLGQASRRLACVGFVTGPLIGDCRSITFIFESANMSHASWAPANFGKLLSEPFENLTFSGPGFYNVSRWNYECRDKKLYLDGVDVTEHAFASNFDEGWVRRYRWSADGTHPIRVGDGAESHVEKYTTYGKLEIR